MKTKLTLTILGAYNMLFGLAAMLASVTMAGEIVNSENPDVIRMGFFIGLGQLMFARNAELATAKKYNLSLYDWNSNPFLHLFRGHGKNH